MFLYIGQLVWGFEKAKMNPPISVFDYIFSEGRIYMLCPSAKRECHKKVAVSKLARGLESLLFHSAPTFERYCDLSSLDERMRNMLAHLIKWRQNFCQWSSLMKTGRVKCLDNCNIDILVTVDFSRLALWHLLENSACLTYLLEWFNQRIRDNELQKDSYIVLKCQSFLQEFSILVKPVQVSLARIFYYI